MKIQIKRLSPHQNAKVFGVLMALGSLLILIPLVIAFSVLTPGFDSQGAPIRPFPIGLFLIFPFLYLVMGYIMTAAGCAIYNFMFKFLGGIEYESRDE